MTLADAEIEGSEDVRVATCKAASFAKREQSRWYGDGWMKQGEATTSVDVCNM